MAWYPFDGNASDMSGNGNHGTISGVTFGADQKGSPNKAGNFNGIDDEVNLGNGANLNPADGLSISAWVNATEIGTWMSVVERYTAQDGKRCYYLGISDNGPARFCVYHGGSSTNSTPVQTQESLQPRKWYFLVGTYHKDNGAHIFVDGSSKAFTQGNQTIQQRMENTYISGYLSKTHKFFKGSIDNVRIYNRAL
ncbi:MAG: LamG domain-containing protein [Verrucomicrobiota bacterium]|nr:LamG domain-containing protein [Verrucomicrobiota bacterium]